MHSICIKLYIMHAQLYLITHIYIYTYTMHNVYIVPILGDGVDASKIRTTGTASATSSSSAWIPDESWPSDASMLRCFDACRILLSHCSDCSHFKFRSFQSFRFDLLRIGWMYSQKILEEEQAIERSLIQRHKRHILPKIWVNLWNILLADLFNSVY